MGYNSKTVFVVCVIAGLSIHGTGAQITFDQNIGTDVTKTIALTGSTNDDTTTLTLDEHFATTITTFIVSGANGTITWTCRNKKLEVTALGALGAVSVKSGNILDYERSPTVTTVLTAVDSTHNFHLSGTVTLTLSLTDVNEKPGFSSSSYINRVANGATTGRIVTTVTAMDPEGAAVTYRIPAGMPGTAFAIDTTNGKITVSSGITITTAASPYILTVIATEAGDSALTDTATVTINVETACTIDSMCNVGTTRYEDCQTFEGANVCKCKTGYTEIGTTCSTEATCTRDSDCTTANNEVCTTIAGVEKRCRCRPDYSDNGGKCLQRDHGPDETDRFDCPALESTHGSLSGSTIEVGATRTLTCDDGYSINGVPTVICQTDRTWDKTLGKCNGSTTTPQPTTSGTTTNPPTTNPTTAHTTNSSSKVSTPLITGVSIGGAVVLVTAILVVVCWSKIRYQARIILHGPMRDIAFDRMSYSNSGRERNSNPYTPHAAQSRAENVRVSNNAGIQRDYRL